MDIKLTIDQYDEIRVALINRIKQLEGRLGTFNQAGEERFVQATEIRLTTTKEALEVIRNQGVNHVRNNDKRK